MLFLLTVAAAANTAGDRAKNNTDWGKSQSAAPLPTTTTSTIDFDRRSQQVLMGCGPAIITSRLVTTCLRSRLGSNAIDHRDECRVISYLAELRQKEIGPSSNRVSLGSRKFVLPPGRPYQVRNFVSRRWIAADSVWGFFTGKRQSELECDGRVNLSHAHHHRLRPRRRPISFFERRQ